MPQSLTKSSAIVSIRAAAARVQHSQKPLIAIISIDLSQFLGHRRFESRLEVGNDDPILRRSSEGVCPTRGEATSRAASQGRVVARTVFHGGFDGPQGFIDSPGVGPVSLHHLEPGRAAAHDLQTVLGHRLDDLAGHV